LAVTINEHLVAQGEQLGHIRDDIDQIESNLKRAEKQMRVFMRYQISHFNNNNNNNNNILILFHKNIFKKQTFLDDDDD